jgi:hypothetical protein
MLSSMEDVSDSQRFKKGQLVWALWSTFSEGSGKMPSAFLARIRKLGELGVPLSEQERPGQAGVDVEYTVEQIFEIAVALKCLDVGLKQSEVAYFISHVREDLRREYSLIMANPAAPGLNILARDRPESPRHFVVAGEDPKGLGDPNRIKRADTSYYMTFRSMELRELWGTRKTKRGLLFYEPKFHRGLASVISEMQHLAEYINDDTRIVIELSNLAALVTAWLKKAPPVRRGRR